MKNEDKRHYPYDARLTPRAKSLRKQMTPEERRLWYDYLRTYPVRFLRQRVIAHYIVDFYCAQAKLVIEVDGAQHYEGDNLQREEERTAFLQGLGLKVLRIPNNAVRSNFEGVCSWIDEEVKQRL